MDEIAISSILFTSPVHHDELTREENQRTPVLKTPPKKKKVGVRRRMVAKEVSWDLFKSEITLRRKSEYSSPPLAVYQS